MVSILQKYEEIYNIKITFSVETEPLGTGKYKTVHLSQRVLTLFIISESNQVSSCLALYLTTLSP